MKKTNIDYCDHCGDMVSYKVEKREKIERKIKGERFFVDENVAVCMSCGSDIFNNKLENENLKRGFNLYAQAHHLLTAEEIIAIRKQYGINQKLFSKSLGFGEVTVQRYESGALPSKSFSDILKRVKSPSEYLKILEENKSALSEDLYTKLKEKITDMIEPEKIDNSNLYHYEQIIKHNFGNPSVYNGFKEFDAEKLFAVTSYLLLQCKKNYGFHYLVKGIYIKLLWFIETAFFQRYEHALIGIQFVKFDMGPVPLNYSILIDFLKDANIISYKEIDYGNTSHHKLFLNKNNDFTTLTLEEKKIIDDVLDQKMPSDFDSLSSQTHEDLRYKNTNNNQPIAYTL